MDKALLKLRNKAKSDLFFLARYVLKYDLLIDRVHEPFCRFLQDMTVHRKLSQAPRGWLKTTCVSRALPIWFSINNPNIRFLLANMVYDNSAKNVHAIRWHWQHNERLKRLFPELVPDFNRVRWSDACAEIRRNVDYGEGTYEAVGIGGSKTGAHYDVIDEDDLICAKKDALTAREILPSPEDIAKAIGWHGLAVSLLINPTKGYIYNTGTRWGQHDLIRHIRDNQSNYHFYELSAVEIDSKGEFRLDKDGNKIPTYPERFSLEVLKEIQEEQGDYVFSMMYLNKPYNVEDMIFREEWILEFEGDPPEVGNVYAGIDVAPTVKRTSDYTGIIIVHVDTGGNLRVLETVRARMNPTETIAKIFELKDKYNYKWISIEKTVVEQLLGHFIKEKNKERRELGESAVVIKPLKRPRGESKAMHVRMLQPYAMAGKLFIRPWMHVLRNELLEFTGRETGHDDLIDAFADIVAHFSKPHKSKEKAIQGPHSVDAALGELLHKDRFPMRRQLVGN